MSRVGKHHTTNAPEFSFTSQIFKNMNVCVFLLGRMKNTVWEMWAFIKCDFILIPKQNFKSVC